MSRNRAGGPPIRWILTTLVVGIVLLALAIDAKAKLRPVDIAYWDRIHQCEQPGSWAHPEQPEYKGGLGIGRAGWRWWAGELGLLTRYPTADRAPRLIQIRVADYGWRVHRGLWTSMRSCGFPPR